MTVDNVTETKVRKGTMMCRPKDTTRCTGRPPKQGAKAEKFLVMRLSAPVDAKMIRQEAEDFGIPYGTLLRAKAKMGFVSKKVGNASVVWCRPEQLDESQSVEDEPQFVPAPEAVEPNSEPEVRVVTRQDLFETAKWMLAQGIEESDIQEDLSSQNNNPAEISMDDIIRIVKAAKEKPVKWWEPVVGTLLEQHDEHDPNLDAVVEARQMVREEHRLEAASLHDAISKESSPLRLAAMKDVLEMVQEEREVRSEARRAEERKSYIPCPKCSEMRPPNTISNSMCGPCRVKAERSVKIKEDAAAERKRKLQELRERKETRELEAEETALAKAKPETQS